MQPAEPAPSSDLLEPGLSGGKALASFTAIALVLTWPLGIRLLDHIPLGAHDIYQNVWNLWWWKTSLLERFSSPYVTDLLFSPGEIPLGNHTHSPANMILTMPVNVLLGEAAALNTAVLASFIFSAHGTFLLARLYTRSAGAAFVAGLAFAYLPQHVEQSLEHVNLASPQAMPYFLWALVSMCRQGGRRWWLATGGFFALNALYSWHNGLMVIPAGLAVFLAESRWSPRPFLACLREALAAGLLAVLVISPFLWPLVRDTLDGVAILQKGFPPKPIHPLFTVIPHPGHPLWGEALFSTYRQGRTYPSVGFIAYLGLIPLALVSTALIARLATLSRRSQRAESGSRATGSDRGEGAGLWIGLALFYLMLSLGSSWTWIGAEGPGEMRLPFHWLREIPLFGLVRVPNRFLVPAALALAVIVGLGARVLARPLRPPARAWLLAALAFLVILDLAWWPYPMRPIPRPASAVALASLPEEGSILDIPGGHRARAADAMMAQTIHGRPLASGYLSTRLHSIERRLEQYPVLRKVFERYPPESANEGPGLVETVRELGIGHVVVHLDRTVESYTRRREEVAREHPDDFYRLRLHNPEKGIPRATLDRFRHELREAFGPPVAAEEEVFEIYRTASSGE